MKTHLFPTPDADDADNTDWPAADAGNARVVRADCRRRAAASDAFPETARPPRPRLDCPFPKIHPSFLHQDDAYFMALAYNQAIEAWRADEVPIGAVIVRDGIVLAAARNAVETQGDATAHAEMLAITQAAAATGNWRLNDCALYVTKEPCPMCAGASVLSRLARVVYAVGDPKAGGLGGAVSIHALPGINHRPALASGILESECRHLLQSYFQLKRALAKPPL